MNPHKNMILMLKKIYDKMSDQIRCDLTFGMADDDRTPYTNEEIEVYIKTHHDAIMAAATEMHTVYLADGNLAELGDGSAGCNDWYCEYLYDYVVPPNVDPLPDGESK